MPIASARRLVQGNGASESSSLPISSAGTASLRRTSRMIGGSAAGHCAQVATRSPMAKRWKKRGYAASIASVIGT
jgi:hypothetical protein